MVDQRSAECRSPARNIHCFDRSAGAISLVGMLRDDGVNGFFFFAKKNFDVFSRYFSERVVVVVKSKENIYCYARIHSDRNELKMKRYYIIPPVDISLIFVALLSWTPNNSIVITLLYSYFTRLFRIDYTMYNVIAMGPSSDRNRWQSYCFPRFSLKTRFWIL